MKAPDMISPRRFWFPMNKEILKIALWRQNEGCLILNCQPERLFWVCWTFSPVGLVGRSLMNISMSLWNQSGRRGGGYTECCYISHISSTHGVRIWFGGYPGVPKRKKKKHALHLLPDGGRINYICGAHTKQQRGVYPEKKSCSGTGYSTEHHTSNSQQCSVDYLQHRYLNFLQLLNVHTWILPKFPNKLKEIMFFSADFEMDKLLMMLDIFCCAVIELQVILEIHCLSVTAIPWKDICFCN